MKKLHFTIVNLFYHAGNAAFSLPIFAELRDSKITRSDKICLLADT